MKKVITMGLNSKSIDNAIKELLSYKKWLKDSAQRLIEELTKIGLDVSRARFKDAHYAGTNDVSVFLEDRGEMQIAIVAIGTATLFIEFGTGIVYPDDHPEKPAGIAARGTYGQGKGSQKTWGFNGEDTGDRGWYATTHVKGEKQPVEKLPHVVLTHGNEANMCMYKTKGELRDKIEEIARRCFNDTRY